MGSRTMKEVEVFRCLWAQCEALTAAGGDVRDDMAC